jgi:hypothetical protein
VDSSSAGYEFPSDFEKLEGVASDIQTRDGVRLSLSGNKYSMADIVMLSWAGVVTGIFGLEHLLGTFISNFRYI